MSQILFAGSQCCTSANLVHLRVLESGNGFNGQREEMENLFLRKTRRNVTQNIFYTHTHAHKHKYQGNNTMLFLKFYFQDIQYALLIPVSLPF